MGIFKGGIAHDARMSASPANNDAALAISMRGLRCLLRVSENPSMLIISIIVHCVLGLYFREPKFDEHPRIRHMVVLITNHSYDYT